MLTGKVYGIVHIFLDVGELLFIIIDDLFRFCPADAEVIRQSESALPVNNTEIDAFGFIAHFLRYVFLFYSEYFSGGGGMDVLPFFESRTHIRIGADGRYY